MWDLLEALLLPVVAILWAFRWPFPDEGFMLLFLILLFWQIQRGHVEVWKKEDQICNLGERSPAQSPANHPASILNRHRLKYRLEVTSDEVWRLGQEHTRDPEAILSLLKRCGLDTFSGKDSCIICQYLRNETQRFPPPPTGWDEWPRPRVSFRRVSRPCDSRLARCTCCAGALPPHRDERPQILQVEEKCRHPRGPGFRRSGSRQSENPKKEDRKDLQALPEAFPVRMKPLSRPSLLSPETRRLLEQHLKSMLHFQQLGLPRWVLEAQWLLAPQMGDEDIQPSFPWRKGLVTPEDSLKSKKEEHIEEHMVDKSRQIIPSVVPSSTPPQALLSSQGPPVLSGPKSLAPPSLDPLETRPRTPDRRTASFPKLSSNLRPREDRRPPAKPAVPSEASMKSLDSVLREKYRDFLSGFGLVYNGAIGSAVSQAELARISGSAEGEPAPVKRHLERSGGDEPNREESKEPRLSLTTDCKEASLEGRRHRHSREARDRDRPSTQTARAPRRKSRGPHHPDSCPSKTSLCPPRAAGGLGAPTGIQERKKNIGQGRGRAPVSNLAARDVAFTNSCGPKVLTLGPERDN
ncbi:uncharacterized protein LOC119932470 [Tachyglossus aculeatus]|uniref:uncharacterized protein LOC119932470 n=1 Tax=Tachyglossus aculeatus TaxID=9261 RepID=UPI0018F66C2C|nr:uncharacterized protein LOC119932470 [Tachyglossus aculeatus]